MTLDPEVLLEIATSTGNCVIDSRRPFPVGYVSIDALVALQQRTLSRFARRFGDSDPLLIEDESIAIVERVLAGIRCNPRESRPSAGVIEHARMQLAARFAEPLSLSELAREVGVSPAYLSRAFRAATGQTLHTFREELRLRRSLDLLPDSRRDFTRVALDLGYSSHSHFSSRFRRYFGITPIEFVQRVSSHALDFRWGTQGAISDERCDEGGNRASSCAGRTGRRSRFPPHVGQLQ
jgi:AraC-like DNA-binding protein